LDGPDGIRTVFSDAATIETDVTLLCDNAFSLSSGFTTSTLDSSVEWDMGADFKPLAFINNLDNSVDVDSYVNGSIIFLHIGGSTGNLGARGTFRDSSERAVRFVSPREHWKKYNPTPQDGKQTPVQLRFQLMRALYPEAPGEENVDPLAAKKHPGPMYPLKDHNFEKPFLVLGGVLEPTLKMSVNSETDLTTTEIDVGIDFDVADTWYSLDDNSRFEDDPTVLSNPLMQGRRTLYGMLTAGGVDRSGASSEVYVAVWGETNIQDDNGAFRVIGAGTAGYTNINASNSTSIVVEPISQGISALVPAGGGAGLSLDVEFRSQYTNSEDGSGSAAGISALAIVLTDIQGIEGGISNPWNTLNLAGSAGADLTIPSAVTSKLEINTTLQYHPGRGGTARIPDDIWRVSLVDGNSTYLRQAVSSIDSDWPGDSGYPDSEIIYDPVHPSLWNRLRGFGLTESSDPKAANVGGYIVDFAEIDRDHEVFADKNSKTIILRPYQDKSMTLRSATTDSDPSLVGVVNYPGTSVPKDGAEIFTVDKTLAYQLPSEFMPRFGRQDIPYYVDTTGTGSGNYLSGINHLFKDSLSTSSPVFNIIGGEDTLSGVLPMLFQTGTSSGLDYGRYGTILGDGFYQARLTNDISNTGLCGLTTEELEVWERLQAVYSWDLGKGLQGIMLPPYLGIARLYGVYDRDDYLAKGGATFEANRATPSLNPAINLLRTDVDQQTLFIFQDGAYDVTLERGDHTYIIPDNVLDLTKAPTYSPGVKYRFQDFEYVVEATIFGFAQNWINENNYLLARLHTGAGGVAIVDSYNYSSTFPPEAEGANMIIPAPVQSNNRVYTGYSRTPYQGDPYMTRAGESRTTSDYQNRYGQVAISNAYYLNESIQQFDSNDVRTVEIPNARIMEVLSSVDFYTTLGTGKVAGPMFPGTFSDVGFVDNMGPASTRIPASSLQPRWKVLPRTYTTGQAGNFNRAGITVSIEGTIGDIADTEISFLTISGEWLTITAVTGAPGTDEFLIGANTNVTATNMAAKINSLDLLLTSVTARASQNKVQIEAVPTGAEGNQILIDINVEPSFGGNVEDWVLEAPGLRNNMIPTSGKITSSHLVGGEDVRVNAGRGNSSFNLTGMTERLPLGILLQDSDFLAENPMVDDSSAFNTYLNRFKPVQENLSIYHGETEYTRFLGDPGVYISQSDGGILRYQAYHETLSPTGSKRFRLYRGGGACQVLSDPVPGGPLDWSLGSFSGTLKPVLKGGVLIGKAMLVRNYPESAFSTVTTTSHGDEIQMLVVTYGVLGSVDSQREGINLSGKISPAGHGEGYAACDRYRLDGHPIVNLHSCNEKEADVENLVVYTGRDTE